MDKMYSVRTRQTWLGYAMTLITSVILIACGPESDSPSIGAVQQPIEAQAGDDLKLTASLQNADQQLASRSSPSQVLFTVQNVGQRDAEGVLLTVTPPPGAVIAKLGEPTLGCTAQGRPPALYWICSLAPLAAGGTSMIQLTIAPSYDAQNSPQIVTAAVSAVVADFTPTDNVASIELFNGRLSLTGGGLSCSLVGASRWHGGGSGTVTAVSLLAVFGLLRRRRRERAQEDEAPAHSPLR